MNESDAFYLAVAFLLPEKCPCSHTQQEKDAIMLFASLLTQLPKGSFWAWNAGIC